MAALQHLLTAAEQGSRLTIMVSMFEPDDLDHVQNEQVTQDSLEALHATVSAQRGGSNTPVLKWSDF
jgi:hypothetical protein